MGGDAFSPLYVKSVLCTSFLTITMTHLLPFYTQKDM